MMEMNCGSGGSSGEANFRAVGLKDLEVASREMDIRHRTIRPSRS